MVAGSYEKSLTTSEYSGEEEYALLVYVRPQDAQSGRQRSKELRRTQIPFDSGCGGHTEEG